MFCYQDRTGLEEEEDGSEDPGAVFEEKRVTNMGERAKPSIQEDSANDTADGFETSAEELEEVFEQPYFLVY